MAAKRFNDSNIHGMLISRMGWNMDDPKCPLRRFVICTIQNETRVVCFFVMDDRYVTIEDDAVLYPSDQLVTQLRLWIVNEGNPQG